MNDDKIQNAAQQQDIKYTTKYKLESIRMKTLVRQQFNQ